jgi:FlaA1/EpsC-like NDP-sugar epimerase
MVFFLYAIIYVVIEDILQAEVYHFHIRIVGYIIVFGVLCYIFTRRAFKDHFRYLRDTQILILMISSLILAYGVQFVIHERIEKEVHEKKVFPNPLYSKYEAVAKKYNLDLTFTKNTIEKRGPVNYKINTIYTKKPKSIDILFIGDSSIAWSLIPEVVEQITGKTVAVFAYESNAMTKKTAKLFDRISKYYLKNNGMLVLSFDNHLYKKNPNTLLISKQEYKEMVAWNKAQFSSFAKSKEGKSDHTILWENQTLI